MTNVTRQNMDECMDNERQENKRQHFYLESRIDSNRRTVQESTDEVRKLSIKVDALIREMEETRRETRQLVRLWETASGVVLFFKWTIGAVTALLVLWALLSEQLKKIIE